MLHSLLPSVTQVEPLMQALFKFDLKLAMDARSRGCPYCGAPLHSATFPRKPRGGPPDLPDEYCRRLGLCCSREGCRRRTLPPSCLFLGQRVYLAASIVLSCAIRQAIPPAATCRELCATIGMALRTLKRWLKWFASSFPTTPHWLQLRGRVDATVPNNRLPGALLERFISAANSPLNGLIACLRFLASVPNILKVHNK